MNPDQEGTGEVNISASGAQIMKVKLEKGEKAKQTSKAKKVRDSIAHRVSKRAKKDGGSSRDASPWSHTPSLLQGQDVVNLMTQALGKKELARACQPDDSPETAPEGWFCIHERYISKCHLRFPLPELLVDLLDHYGLALSQLCPSVIRVINVFITRAAEVGLEVELRDLMSLFAIKESSSKSGGSGTYYLSSRPKLGIFKSTGSDDDWRKRYFFVKIDPLTVPPGRDLRVAWSNASG